MTILEDFGKWCGFWQIVQFFINPADLHNFLWIFANHADFGKKCRFWKIVRILIQCADFHNFGKSCGFLKNPVDFDILCGFC